MPGKSTHWLLVALFAMAPLATGAAMAPTSAQERTASAVADSSIRAVRVHPDSVLYIAPVMEVRASRLSRQEIVDRASGFGQVLERSAWSGGVETAASVLSRAVGVNVREAGGIGSYSTVSLRGSTPEQVPIYLDGIPLSRPEAGAVNLADIPLGSLERIEVYRGAAPLVLGGSSLGGAIHLVSRSRNEPANLHLAVGSHGTRTIDFGGGRSRGAWTALLRARVVTSQGDWRFPFDNRTPFNPQDDFDARRGNNDTRGGGGLLSARARLGGWTIGLSEMLDAREHGIPGRDLQAGSARGHSLTHQFRVAVRPAVPDRRVRRLELFHRIDRQGFDDRAGELGLGQVQRTDVVQSLGGALVGSATPKGHELWRLEGRWAQLTSRNEFPVEERGAPQTRATVAAAVQPVLRFFDGRLAVSPGLRGESHWDGFHGVPLLGNYALPGGPRSHRNTWASTAQLGLRWNVTDGLALKANLGHHDRVPTLLERFGNRGSVIGNPDLRVESGTNRDIGVVWARPSEGRRMLVSLFHNDSTDLIAFVRNSQQTAKAVNVGSAEVKGVEVYVDLGRLGFVRQEAGLTRLVTRDTSSDATFRGKPLPGRPGHELYWRTTLGPSRWSVGYEVVAMGSNTMERHGRTQIPARILHNLHADWRASHWSLQLRCTNLADVRDDFDLFGWPLPGRQLTISLQLRQDP